MVNIILTCLQLEIMILGDFSYSVHGYEHFVVDAMKSVYVEGDVRMGAAIFNDGAYLVSPLTDPVEAKMKINYLNQMGAYGNTDLTYALVLGGKELLSGMPGYRKVIVLITDGSPDDGDSALAAALQLRQLGVKIYVIAIKDADFNDTYLKLIADQYLETNYEGLSKELKKLDICL